MDPTVIISGTDILTGLVGLIAFSAGYFLKGVFFALLSEVLYKPIAKWIISKADEWEETHPLLLATSLHFLDRHEGLRPSQCDTGKCSRVN